ncbi:DUF3231 family protein [Desulfolucanica intricata]|uniref:DUF3231 family protein n=1 Tax=Desulfolucanica intricata TaxID=1285191 RepID=UPI0008333B33|nr:DUF3231 family protein [Desulfolucanica intricata]
MVFGIRFYNIEKAQGQINIEETYNLWDLLTTKYALIDHLQIWRVFAHDKDLDLIMNKALNSRKQYCQELEDMLSKFSIGGPDKPRVGVSTSVKPEVLNDQRISAWLLTWMQEEIELILRAIRTSTTNDDVRSLFIKIASTRIEELDSFIKYIKLKGWVNQPPLYPNVPPATNDKIDTGEAFHLWDHLTFRYDNIQQTQLWYEYANDGDFKALLKKGLHDILKKQAQMLEKELLLYGITMPNQPTDIIQGVKDKTILKDDYMFRILFFGMMGALWLHTLGLKQCITNDRIRGIFKDLLLSEIGFLDKLIKFGKTKGWLNVVPSYSPVQ